MYLDATTNVGGTVYLYFNTHVSGVPTTLAGSPAIVVYKDGSLTQSTAGVTLDVDFDSVTGINRISVDTSADGTFYEEGAGYQCVISAGTVGGNSVVGVRPSECRFGILNPTTTSNPVPATIVTGGIAAASFAAGAVTQAALAADTGLKPVRAATALETASTTTATLDISASAVDNAYQWCWLLPISGPGASSGPRLITSYNGTTKVCQVSPNWLAGDLPTSLTTAVILPRTYIGGISGTVTLAASQPNYAPTVIADLTTLSAHGDSTWATATGFAVPGSAMTLSSGAIVAGSFAANAITDAAIAVPAETAGRPTRVLAMLRRLWEGRHNKRTRNRTTGVAVIRNAADSGDLETATQATVSVTDSQTQGA